MKKQRRRAYLNIILTASVIVTLFGITVYETIAAWSPETNLTNSEDYWDKTPSITQTRDGTMWVVWASDRNVYAQFDIYYVTSSDFGSTWSSPIRFTWHKGTDDTPCITETLNGSIWIVWSSDRYGDFDIMYCTSPDHGSTWSPIVVLTNDTCNDDYPSVTQSVDGTIWAVWHRKESSNSTIYYKISFDFGATWSEAANLTTKDSRWDTRPYITQTDDGTMWVVWASRRLGQWEIYYKTTSDNGLTWSDATLLPGRWTNDDITPAILQSANGTIWVLWASGQGDQAATFDIYYKTSSDYGTTWTDNATLVSLSDDDQNPAVTSTNERRIWVVWHSRIEGFNLSLNYEILYKISDEIVSVHDIALTDMTPWVSRGFNWHWVPQGEPIYINITVENQGTFEENPTVSVYADSSVGDVHIDIGTQDTSLTAGANTTLTFTWNTSDTPYGNYYISANATIVPGEHDTADNIILHGAKIGGICVPYQLRHINILALLTPIASATLIIVALGIAAITFFKILMSPRLRWT